MARHRRRAGPAVRQAQADAQLRYGPQAQALGELLFQARDDYRTRVKAERGAARGVQTVARATIPKVKKDYASTLKFAKREQATITPKLTALGPAANDIKAASLREASGARRRIQESRTDAVTELRQRISQAAAGAAFAVSNARSEYAGKRQTIERQLLNVAGQQGLFAATQALANRKASRDYKLALRKATADIGAKKANVRHQRELERQGRARIGISRKNAATSRYRAQHPSKRRDRPTHTQRVAARDKYEHAIVLARILSRGGKGKSGKRYKPLNEVDQIAPKLVDQGIPLVLARAAAQRVLHGGVGPKTRRRAHRRYGIKLPHGSRAARLARSPQLQNAFHL